MPTAPERLTRVSTRHHALVRACRAAARGDRTDLVLLDGAHVVIDAIRAGADVESVLVTAHARASTPDLDAALNLTRAAVYDATDAVLDAASPARSPSGVVALAHWSPPDIARLFSPPPALVVGLVDVQDPGNVGGVIRTADALGATGVVALGQSADPGGWKAIRGSMGSLFRLPAARSTLAAVLAAARAAQVQVVATTPRGGIDPHQAKFAGPTLLLLGHEGAGLSSDVISGADRLVTIPMRAGVESLNVGVAAALLLDEARHQRHRSAT